MVCRKYKQTFENLFSSYIRLKYLPDIEITNWKCKITHRTVCDLGSAVILYGTTSENIILV